MSEYLPDEVGHFCRSLLISLALSCGSLLMYMSFFCVGLFLSVCQMK